MNRIAGILVFFLLAGAGNQLFGQSGMAPGSGSASTKAIGGEELSFFVDEESETYFIDFESIRANLSEIALKNAKGDILFHERVSDLPVDAIYELNVSPYSPGKYRIELYTFTGVIAKDIQVH